MTRRLFLTGPMGCGKSTAIASALGAGLSQCGGFRTRRIRDDRGHAAAFYLESPDTSRREVFLNFSGGKPEVRLEVFETLGTELLQSSGPCVLDEIGGIELLCPAFADALDMLLKSDVPILGVMKGEGPAGALIEALGLSRKYEQAAGALRLWMKNDEDTLLYECSQFDENALALARAWAEEYLHD